MPETGRGHITLILGLGNIGSRYDGTRHNIGFDVLDRIAESHRAGFRKADDLYDLCTITAGEHEVPLVKPRTYVNRSGWAAEDLLQRYDLMPEQMLVVVDDFALPLGRLRFRSSGSDGGHNGLLSMIETLGTTSFPRLRLGIGPAPEGIDPADFVLARFAPDELEAKEAMIRAAAEAVVFTIDHRFDEAMSTYNANPAWLPPTDGDQAV